MSCPEGYTLGNCERLGTGISLGQLLNTTVRKDALHQYSALAEIEIRPLEGQRLGNPESKAPICRPVCQS